MRKGEKDIGDEKKQNSTQNCENQKQNRVAVYAELIRNYRAIMGKHKLKIPRYRPMLFEYFKFENF